MKQLEYSVRFTTPAFLGNAEQSGQWRTPPFKALLRQWWRVAYAAEHNFPQDVVNMRREEGLLFGHAWLEGDTFERNGKMVTTAARKSLVRIRLEALGDGDAWGKGTQAGVSPLSTGLDTSYAWFGLVKRGAGEPDRIGIATHGLESSRALLLAIPDQHAQRVETAVRLIAQFGQLGSRSRGGWGSLHIDGVQDMSREELARFAQPLDACLRHDWPMSLCTDARGLCMWESQWTFPSWDKAMRVIAAERRNARLALKSLNGRDLRPVLGFASPGRMPSPLRWRVFPGASSQLAIRVFAMPTLIPEDGKQHIDTGQIKVAWNQVIEVMDASQAFKPRSGRT